ncbi:hypothetical protein ACFWIY_23675 [Streptomyces sioyaensis]|uniref:hypothetical protein n=1 Tax=Streptomyces sioyaensis TaxID=67364 RepID=UPI003666036A
MTRVRAKTWSGETWDDPDEDKLYNLLSEMNLVHRVLIVEPLEMPESPGQHFIRVYLNDDKSCLIEYSEGGPGSQFQATVPAPFEMYGHDLVAEVVKSWARDDGEWRAALPWKPVPVP